MIPDAHGQASGTAANRVVIGGGHLQRLGGVDIPQAHPAMKPPEESPDTVVCVLSMLSWGRLTAAEAAPPKRAAAAAKVQRSVDFMSVVSGFF